MMEPLLKKYALCGVDQTQAALDYARAVERMHDRVQARLPKGSDENQMLAQTHACCGIPMTRARAHVVFAARVPISSRE
jgi:hypothetical protein